MTTVTTPGLLIKFLLYINIVMKYAYFRFASHHFVFRLSADVMQAVLALMIVSMAPCKE